MEEGLLAEGTLRNWINKYESSSSEDVYSHEFIDAYNQYAQKQILPALNVRPNIHILDCSEIEVHLNNGNYEHSAVIKDQAGPRRGYKNGTLRGIMKDTGLLEEIKLGSIKIHDLELCRNMLLTSESLKPGDILINDRGFLSRTVMNTLKATRGVDTYVPVRKNMDVYTTAVSVANEQNKWQKHPNLNRKTQRIAFVGELGPYWQSDTPKNDVPLNACVVHDSKEDEYFVFVTTDTSKTAKQIIKIYEIRPEIEE
ncbi:transposase, partial [Candidatus Hakubella thermalkaliphila]|uniref:transposase n=1 Tax=Candidatus Hakubella thermalkaliphila TaxID=2754717 RepID=UPI001593D141